MPQSKNNRYNQQWDTCDRCGRLFPMGYLVKQKGLLICTDTCYDNLEVERRPYMIQSVIGPTPEVEGADLRVIDRGFFIDFDIEIQH